jgi:hypothetical protein
LTVPPVFFAGPFLLFARAKEILNHSAGLEEGVLPTAVLAVEQVVLPRPLIYRVAGIVIFPQVLEHPVLLLIE